MRTPLEQLAIDAAEAHSNLNAWGAVDALLESGLLYAGRGIEACRRIQRITSEQRRKELAIYDARLAKLAAWKAKTGVKT